MQENNFPRRLVFDKKPLKRKPKSTFKITVALTIAIIVIVSSTAVKYKKYTSSPLNPENTQTTSVLIKKGDTAKDIGKTLEEKEIIKSAWAFYWYARLNEMGEKIVSGRFMLSPSMNVRDILAKISDPLQSEAVLTIQEGLKITDMDTRLSDMGLTEKGEFTEAAKKFKGYEYYEFLSPEVQGSLSFPIEGYLFPDTYFLEPTNFHPDHVIYKALDNFEKKIEPYIQKIKNSGRSFHEIITMASILEKEVISDEDRRKVSGILWKRLDSGWRIDADATLLYTKNDNKITSSDLKENNPYNTRLLKGLPPGPICSPSIKSIEAAINPEKSNYWFYLSAKKDGKTIFAVTNEEHERNKAKHL